MKKFSVIRSGGPLGLSRESGSGSGSPIQLSGEASTGAGGWMAWMLVVLFLAGMIACTKTKSSTVNNPSTPLQTLVNTDTTLTLFHHLLLRGNDVALLADDSATILIPTNNALRLAGFPESIIDSASSAVADRLLRYQYLPSGLVADSGTLTANPTLLGSPIYAERLGGVIVFNTTSYSASGTPLQVGKAKVYFLNSTLTPPVDSLPELLFQDTSLSFFAAAVNRTNFYDSAILPGGASFTLLAPNNDAFRNAGYDSVGAIDSADYGAVVQLLANQFIKGTYFSSRFPASVQRLQGSDLIVSYSGGMPHFTTAGNPNPVNLLSVDLVAGPNLILHFSDGLLSP